MKMFDYIYHEHFSYFTLEVIRNLFNQCGLELLSAVKTSPKGGSIRVIAQLKGGKLGIDKSVSEIILDEQRSGMKEEEVYKKFALEINDLRDSLLDLLRDYKNLGLRIVGFGASHSTTTLTYHFKLLDYMEYIVDDNELKHGRFSPGYNLPVYPTQKLYEDCPDVVILLAWQHSKTILSKLKSFLKKGKVVVPLPKLQIFD